MGKTQQNFLGNILQQDMMSNLVTDTSYRIIIQERYKLTFELEEEREIENPKRYLHNAS